MTLGEACRSDFPILARPINGRSLVYLDSGASSQKPRQVLEAMQRFYERSNANVHRSIHTLGEEATEQYEAARDAVRGFVAARFREEIVLTRGTTDGVNIVAAAVGRTLRPGDEVVVSEMEHHSNLIPWQLACRDRGAVLRAIPLQDGGYLDMEAYARLLGPRTRVVAVAHVSNVLGTINPVAEVVRQAKAAGALVLLDGAQAAPHLRLDLASLGCDFYVFSGHKMLGPTGIGVLYGRRETLERLEPGLGGSEMIKEVWIDHAQWNDLPWRFEPGTPPIAEAVGLHAAVEYLDKLGMDRVSAHERDLTRRCLDALSRPPRRDDLRAPQSRDEGGGGRLQRGGPPPARRGRPPRPVGRRGAGGASLRPAPHARAGHRGHAPGELLRLQHLHRHRAPCRGRGGPARSALGRGGRRRPRPGGRAPVTDHPRPTDAFSSPRFGQPATFMRLPHLASPAGLDVALYGIPFDGGCSYRPGARFGPRHIREHSSLIRPWNSALDVQPFERLRVADCGDVDIVPISIEGTFAAIERTLGVAVEGGAAPLCAGVTTPSRSPSSASSRGGTAAWDSCISTRTPTPGTATSAAVLSREHLQAGRRGGADRRRPHPSRWASGGLSMAATISISRRRTASRCSASRRSRRAAWTGWPAAWRDWPADPSTAPSTLTPLIQPMRPAPARRRWAGSRPTRPSPSSGPSGPSTSAAPTSWRSRRPTTAPAPITGLLAANLLFELLSVLALRA